MLKLQKIRITKDLWLGDDWMDEEKANYYVIIPASVRYDNRLTANEKLLYGEITSLCDDKGECIATNKHLSELLRISKLTVSRGIANLEKLGYIERLMIFKNNSKEIDYRILKSKTYHSR